MSRLLRFVPYDHAATAPDLKPHDVRPDLFAPGTTPEQLDAWTRARWCAKRSGFTFIIILDNEGDELMTGQQPGESYSATYTRKGHNTSHTIQQQNGLSYRVRFARVGYFKTFAEAMEACERTYEELRA